MQTDSGVGPSELENASLLNLLLYIYIYHIIYNIGFLNYMSPCTG